MCTNRLLTLAHQVGLRLGAAGVGEVDEELRQQLAAEVRKVVHERRLAGHPDQGSLVLVSRLRYRCCVCCAALGVLLVDLLQPLVALLLPARQPCDCLTSFSLRALDQKRPNKNETNQQKKADGAAAVVPALSSHQEDIQQPVCTNGGSRRKLMMSCNSLHHAHSPGAGRSLAIGGRDPDVDRPAVQSWHTVHIQTPLKCAWFFQLQVIPVQIC